MKDLETIILPVLEMSCAVCANNVENTVKGLPGVGGGIGEFRGEYAFRQIPSILDYSSENERGRAGGRIRFGRGGRGSDGGTGRDGTRALPEATPEYDRGVGYFPFRWPCWEWCLCIRPAVTGS